MNKKIILLGTLTLCITTASLAMEQEDLKQDGWELVSNNDEWFFLDVDTPKKIPSLTVLCGQDSDSSDDYPVMFGEISDSSDNHNTEAGGSGNDLGYSDHELINDEELRDIVRKVHNMEPGDLDEKTYIVLLRLTKIGVFDEKPSLSTIKSILPLHAPSLIALHKFQSSETQILNKPKKTPAKKGRKRKKKKRISPKLLWPKMNTKVSGNPQRVLADKQKKKNVRQKKQNKQIEQPPKHEYDEYED